MNYVHNKDQIPPNNAGLGKPPGEASGESRQMPFYRF